MPCEQTELQLHGYLDGELDAAGMANFERHAATCPDCGRVLAAEQSLRRSLQNASLYERAPVSLRENFQREFSPARPPVQPTAVAWWRWPAFAAFACALVLLAWQLLHPLNGGVPRAAIASAVLDAHLRSLQPGHLADVVSTDQHTVKPWFDGRVDFAPPVRDFSEQGFPLLGGRLDVLQGQTVATLAYGRRKHIINVFVWKSATLPAAVGSGDGQGYHWLVWQADGLTFYTISDVSSSDLDQLRQLFLAH